MGARVTEAIVGAATVAAAFVLVFLLASPILPQPVADAGPSPTLSPTPAASAPATEPGVTPIGLYLLRDRFSFGPCLAFELIPQSYPVAAGAVGEATVTWWQRGMTGCDGRTGDLHQVPATVEAVPDEDEPAAGPIAYRISFAVPAVDFEAPPDGAPTIEAIMTILARQSTDTVLQAIEEDPSSGQGYVLDRVEAVDPPLNPLPSVAP
jgi:hypothetical protein